MSTDTLEPPLPPPFPTIAVTKLHHNVSRQAVEGLIAAGHVIIIFEGWVLNLDGWEESHPGGRLPLLHMVGHDASSEIAA